ncbi:hypothetical protein ABFX02_01G047100 [Erythranthe guttata]
MGSSSSKHNAPGQSPPPPPPPPPPPCEAVVRRSRSRGSRVLRSSCLRSHRSDCDEPQVSNSPSEENSNSVYSPTENKSSSCQVSAECYSKDNDINCVHWGESSFTNTVSLQANTSSRNFSSRSLNPPSRFISRFTFNPGNLSFRLTRGNSCPAPSTGLAISNDEEEFVGPTNITRNRNNRHQGCDFFPACFTSSRTRHNRSQDENIPSISIPDLSDNFQDNRELNRIESDEIQTRNSRRRIAAREPVETNVRFSRTLSVGRLRDRVLRRNATAVDLDLDLFQQDGELGPTSHHTHEEVQASADYNNNNNNLGQQVSSGNVIPSFSNPFNGGQNNSYETPRARETRYRDLLEHRSNFIERRRRIRSQVRALQRLGSRFENLSGHERSCILSGQHQGGQCTCRISSREANSNNDANARASISRIVMLAEALFEVLDEIHQQSVVLPSRPSVSSIGSVPAPSEVVDSLPLIIFSNFKRKPCEDAAQCYICLVEYEDGDSMRSLPCHHEFHRACIDKWLKEVHRVCPVCRRDICRPESLTTTS